jgi:hypothetical protein
MKKITFLVLTLLSYDPPGDARLTFQNNSSFPIILAEAQDEGKIGAPYKFYECTSNKLAHTYVKSGEKHGYPTSPGGNWEILITRYPNQTLLFIVYNADSATKYIDNYGCDSLGKRNDLVLKRFDVTVDYLKKNNWTLTYP